MEKLLLVTHPDNPIEVRIETSEFLTNNKQCYFMKNILSEDILSPLANMNMISQINSIAKWKEAFKEVQSFLVLIGKEDDFKKYLSDKSKVINPH